MAPSAPRSLCLAPGCAQDATSDSRCDTHQKQKRQHARRFQTAGTRYNSARWIRLRDRFRTAHPFCCTPAGRDARCTLLTEIVDHVTPHRGSEALMYDETNLQPLCWHCHSVKTAREVGFGGG